MDKEDLSDTNMGDPEERQTIQSSKEKDKKS